MMKMKKILFYSMLATTATVVTCCSEEDPFQEFADNGNEGWTAGGNMMGGNGNSATTGELATFDIAIDKTTAEPTEAASAYYPEAEDNIAQQTFDTKVNIDMSNPVATTENGVEITVSDPLAVVPLTT